MHAFVMRMLYVMQNPRQRCHPLLGTGPGGERHDETNLGQNSGRGKTAPALRDSREAIML